MSTRSDVAGSADTSVCVAAELAAEPDGARAAPPSVRDRLPIDGLSIDRVDLAEALARITASCEARGALQVVTVNTNFMTLARRRPDFRDAINDAGLVVADGRLLLWVARLLGTPLPAQVTGHDLVRDCVPLAATRGWRVFLLGGEPGVARAFAAQLEREHPGLRAAGDDGGRFSADGRCDDAVALARRRQAFQPQLLFVALGAPKQDLWISHNLPTIPPCVAVGVGGVFDVLTGRLPRAPRWMQVAGLESLFQLVIAPRRYARRYLLEDPPTLLSIVGRGLVQRLRRRSSA